MTTGTGLGYGDPTENAGNNRQAEHEVRRKRHGTFSARKMRHAAARLHFLARKLRRAGYASALFSQDVAAMTGRPGQTGQAWPTVPCHMLRLTALTQAPVILTSAVQA